MQAYHASVFCHLGVARTPAMPKRFYLCVGTDIFTEVSRAGCASPPLASLLPPLPSGPGVTVSVDRVGPFPGIQWGTIYRVHYSLHGSLQSTRRHVRLFCDEIYG